MTITQLGLILNIIGSVILCFKGLPADYISKGGAESIVYAKQEDRMFLNVVSCCCNSFCMSWSCCGVLSKIATITVANIKIAVADANNIDLFPNFLWSSKFLGNVMLFKV